MMPKGVQNGIYDKTKHSTYKGRDIFLLASLKEHGMKDVCLIWPYGQHHGYGAISDNNGGSVGVHRIALEYKLGRSIATGLFACHKPIKCHNPLCYAMAHLYEGSVGDNSIDMIADNTALQGEKSPMHKLTESEVLAIRDKWATGMFFQREIADEYNVSSMQISRIVRNKRWPHI